MAEETVVAEAIEANTERADSATVDMDMVEDVEANGVKRAREGEEEENEDVSKKQKVDKSVEEERLEKLEEEGKGEGEGEGEEENEDVSKKQKVDKSVEEEQLEKLEEEGEGEGEEENEDVSKKQKVDKSVEEERLEKLEEEGEGEEEEKSGPVSLGPKSFGSAVEMFDYFYNFLHQWPPNLKVNKYEHMVLVDLLKTGHSEPDKKIGGGIQAFQVRFHPRFKSRCFFLIRDDDSVDDFSFRKCVDHILPLPEDVKVKSDNFLGGGKGHGGKGGPGGRGGRGRGRGRGYGRGGRSRN